MTPEKTPNQEKRPGFDDANADPGTGASSPGEEGYQGESGVNIQGGEAEIELEERRRALEEDPGADPAENQGA